MMALLSSRRSSAAPALGPQRRRLAVARRAAAAAAVLLAAGTASVRLAAPAWGQDATDEPSERKPLAGTTALPATVPATAPAAAPAVITQVTIREDRQITSDDGAAGASVGRTPETAVEFLVAGGGARRATRVVDAHVDEAVDDLGNDLLTRADMADQGLGRLQALRRALHDGGAAPAEPRRKQPEMRLWASRTERDGIEVRFDLAQTVRRATAVKRLRGRFALAVGGTRQTVTIDKPLTRAGDKGVDDPTLVAAGLRIVLAAEKSRIGRGPSTISVQATGRPEALAKVRVLTAEGRVAGESFADRVVEGGEGSALVILHGQPIDDTMRVELELVAGQKLLPFVFDLKDVPLP